MAHDESTLRRLSVGSAHAHHRYIITLRRRAPGVLDSRRARRERRPYGRVTRRVGPASGYYRIGPSLSIELKRELSSTPMKPGRGSRTAVLVCMGRAVAHEMTTESRFADPTALALLPDEARARVERFLAGAAPKGILAHFEHNYLDRQSNIMVARTVAIDDAVRGASSPQLVIL